MKNMNGCQYKIYKTMLPCNKKVVAIYHEDQYHVPMCKKHATEAERLYGGVEWINIKMHDILVQCPGCCGYWTEITDLNGLCRECNQKEKDDKKS